MSALSLDPLTICLDHLRRLPTIFVKDGPGHASSSQLAHITAWNAAHGIRIEMHRAGVLSLVDSVCLEQGLSRWPWLGEADRRDVNRAMNMLFFIRKMRANGSPNYNRSQLSA